MNDLPNEPIPRFRDHIVNAIMQPHYVADIKTYLKDKRSWRVTGMSFETMSKILLGIGSVLSFSAGSFNNQLLSFCAGTLSTLSLVALQFSQFSYREMKKSNEELTRILQALRIDPTMPPSPSSPSPSPSLSPEQV